MSRPEPDVVDPEVTPHRPRKNRRRWCRGKVGVEHATEVALCTWAVTRRMANPRAELCRWWGPGDWQTVAYVEHGVAVDDWRWTCSHVEMCVNCGRKLRQLVGTQCPDWKPR